MMTTSSLNTTCAVINQTVPAQFYSHVLKASLEDVPQSYLYWGSWDGLNGLMWEQHCNDGAHLNNLIYESDIVQLSGSCAVEVPLGCASVQYLSK